MTTFKKSICFIKYPMPYAIYMPPNTKRPRNKPNDGCLWKPAKRNSFRTSKHLQFVAITETFNGSQALVVFCMFGWRQGPLQCWQRCRTGSPTTLATLQGFFRVAPKHFEVGLPPLMCARFDGNFGKTLKLNVIRLLVFV